MMQGEYLAHIFSKARASMEDGGIIAMDLNGVPDGMYHSVGSEMRSVHNLQNDPIIGPALNHVDILHMNEDELCNLTGCDIQGTLDSEMEDDFAVAKGAQLFLMCGVAVVAVTRGKKGCFICCNDEERFARSKML
jgi:sugar/nucleoside kinase (ribokinase family)